MRPAKEVAIQVARAYNTQSLAAATELVEADRRAAQAEVWRKAAQMMGDYHADCIPTEQELDAGWILKERFLARAAELEKPCDQP